MRVRSTLLLSLTLAAGIPLRGQIGAMQGANTIGVFRQNPSSGLTDWVVDSDGAHAYNANDGMFWFGLDGDLPIMGDWTNSQHLQMGTFRDGYWYVDWNDNKYWDSADQIYGFGLPGDIPVVGDWDHTGKLRMGVYRVDSNGLGWWYVSLHTCTDSFGCNFWGPGGVALLGVDYDVFQWGLAGDIPVVGDWDGAGVLRVGVFRPSTNQWVVNLSTCNDASCGSPAYISYNPNGGQPIVGIWNAGGTLNLGQFLGGVAGAPSEGQWAVQANSGSQNYSFGLAGDVAVMGPWSLAITTTSLPNGLQSTPYTASMSANGGLPPYTWSGSGSLPPGLAVTSGGNLTGTPTTLGTYTFTATVTDSASNTASQAFSMSISPGMPAISQFSPTTAQVGAPVTITGTNFGATQGNGTVTFGGVPATVQSWSASQIVALVPSGLTAGYDYYIYVTASGYPAVSPPYFIPQDFNVTLSSPSPSAAVLDSGTVSYTVTVAPAAGFTGTVQLTAPGLPPGAAASFSPATVTIVNSRSVISTLIVTAPSAGTGNLTVTANGTSGSLSHSAVSTLSLQDFTVTLSPYNANTVPVLPQGGQQTFTISTAGINGFTGNIAFSYVTGSPVCGASNVTVPPPVPAGNAASLILTMNPLFLGTCYFQVKATANGDTHTLNGWLQVTNSANFTFTLNQGTLTATPTVPTVTFQPTVTAADGFCNNVSFQVKGLPAGATLSAPGVNGLCGSNSYTAQIAITVAPGTVPGTYPLSISASGPGVTQYVFPYLQVSAGTSMFTLSITPLQSIAPGGAATYTISVTPAPGANLGNGVGLSVAGISGASSALIPSRVLPGAPVTLTINASPTMPIEVVPVLVTGTLGSATQTVAASLSVQALIAGSGSPSPQNVAANGTAYATVYSFSAGNANWITGACSTTDPNITATVSNQRSSSATITYTANILTTNRTATASCSYTCPSGPGTVTFPPVTISPAPVIYSVTDAAGNPNPVVYSGVPTTLIINGAYFGTTQGGIGTCPDGASPCIVPPSLCNPSCGSYTIVSWNDAWIEVVLTVPPGAGGEWDTYVMSVAWITGQAANNPSRGEFDVLGVQVTPGPTAIMGFNAPSAGIPPTNCVPITANGQPAGGAFQWATTSQSVNLQDANMQTATVCSNAGFKSSKSGDVPVTVTYTVNGQTTPAATTTVTILWPNAIQTATDVTNATGHQCIGTTGTIPPNSSIAPSSYYIDTLAGATYTSYLRVRTYQIQDQFQNQIMLNMSINESYNPSAGITIGSGEGYLVTDDFYYCSQTCRQGGSETVNSTQTISLNNVNLPNNKAVTWTCSGATIMP